MTFVEAFLAAAIVAGLTLASIVASRSRPRSPVAQLARVPVPGHEPRYHLRRL
jgi:hypothetical protein